MSIRTVAERAGVSIATVSNVLNNRTHVGPDLALRVRAAVDELGYVTDGVASRLRSRRHTLVGVVVPSLAAPLFAGFVSTLEELARQDGVDLMVASCRNDPANEAERLSAIRSWRPAGCIVIPVDGDLEARRPKGGDMPIVVADRIPDSPDFDVVTVDNTEAAATVVRHCVDRGLRRMLVVGSDLSIGHVGERWEGARAAAAGLDAALEWLPLGGRPDGIRDGLMSRLTQPSRPDVVFCLDHGTTRAAYEALRALGLAIPQDVALVSFDDMEWMSLVTPGITAVHQPFEAMAQAAWRCLMDRASGLPADFATLRLSCRLIERGSTLTAKEPRSDALPFNAALFSRRA